MKKSLTGAYSAPAHLLEVQNEAPVPAAMPSYQDQRFLRSVDMEPKTYKQRMEEPARKRLKGDPAEHKGGEAVDGDGKTREDAVAGKDGKDGDRSSDDAEAERSGGALTDAVLDAIIPPGYIKATPPEGYGDAVAVYEMPKEVAVAAETLPEYDGIAMTKEDVKHFAILVTGGEPSGEPSGAERMRWRAAELVLRAKNGAPPARRKAMRALRAQARALGPAHVLPVVLPLMLEPMLADGDRHLLGKVLARTIPQWDDAVRPYTHQIVTAVGPQLIDPDMTLRLEARDAVAALARAAGLAAVVAALRPDLDHADEYVRNITARVFAVVAVTLGLAKVVPFVRAVVRLKKSWHARHTGIRIVHHLCVLLGGGNGAPVLPHLAPLVEVLRPALGDELVQVRTATAATMAQLAESVRPYGVAAFEPVLPEVWAALKHHRGRALAAFLRCMGAVVPLMAHDRAYAEHASYYTRELVRVVAREFGSADDEMRRAVLRVVQALPLSRVVLPQYRAQLVAPFFRHMCTRRAALELPQMARLVADTAVHLARALDAPAVVEQMVPLARDANDNLRRMAADALGKILARESMVELDPRLDAGLLDAVLHAFQEQQQPHPVFLGAVAAAGRALGPRLTPHVPELVSTVLYRMKHSDPEVRQQAADLAAAVALLLPYDTVRKLILFLYELLGEVYPEVLGSIVGALHGCMAALDRGALVALDNPLLAALLPTLTPILKNRHEKVQEECIRVVGLIARTHADSINAKEWMRVCFDLLDMLKALRRRIRVAANATFGHIAATIGPQDVLAMLLNNLRVQERQLRVCTGVAIAIVADTCAPFTVLPALMNEYRVPDKNVQNAVLKALSFMFEYLDGATLRLYVYAVTPLLQDALTDRDQVHRQTAATVVRHLALNCAARGAAAAADDVFVHLINLVLPNIYEVSPHVIIRIVECLDALRLAVGVGVFSNYVWAGLFHAARKVRAPYWKLYNAAYVHQCDALVPFYPRLAELHAPPGELGLGHYNVDELDIWI